MAARKSPGTDFESRYFDLLIDRLDRQDDLLAAIHQQTQKTNGRVTKLEGSTSKLEAKVFKSIVPWYSDTRLLYIAGVCVMVFLLIVAAVLKVQVPTGIRL